ncbi:unnamed protein product [Ixodes hexagonus]
MKWAVVLFSVLISVFSIVAVAQTVFDEQTTDVPLDVSSAPTVAKLTWKGFMRNMTSTFGTVLQKIFPLMVRASSEVEIGPDCMASYLKVFLGLRKLKGWAVRRE